MQAIFNDWAMHSKSVQAEILRIWFCLGWPETLISDHVLCYTAEAFTSVMNTYHVNHITSSPHSLQSNRWAEKYDQIVKSLFYKAKEGGKDLF